ncbi:MAG TPA: undecaprenyl-diphosphate phosphatase [Bacteroidales bacterium]|nr:undecaprenyl-diphosphate phosphatase [Bacteroidales bacterium]
MDFIQAIIIAVVEGLTEFLPISSTGHMVFAASLLGIEKDAFTKLFIESIQFGAILSVIVLYWRKFFDFKRLNLYVKLFIAFLPAAIIGVLLKKHIDMVLEKPMFIAVITFLGGILLLFVDKWFKNNQNDNVDNMTHKNSLVVGTFQLLAIILPGFSRSAATIIGGMQQKFTRKAAAEFSFFLAVPTLAGAFAKSMWDAYKETPELLSANNMKLLAVGNIVAFVVAMIAIKTFISVLTKYGFKGFGYYRIIIGAIILILLFAGIDLNFVG